MAGTPTNVTSVRTGVYTVELSWSAPTSSTPSIAGYEMFYAVSGSDVIQSGGTTTTSTTTISVTLPKLDFMYTFFVIAFSDAGNTLPSARSNIIVLTELSMFIMKSFSIHLVFVARCMVLIMFIKTCKYTPIMLIRKMN